VARVAARLGLPTGWAGALGHDAFGEELWQLTRQAELDLRFVQRVDRPTLLAMVVSKDPPHYFFVGERTADLAFNPDRLPARWLEEADVVYFGSLSLLRPPTGERLLMVAGLYPGAAAPEGLCALRALAPAAQVLFTRGPDGMRLLGAALEVDRLVYPGPVVDTVGAGDACVGAWMASLLTRPGASPADHVDWAAGAAAVSCARAGAYAGTREEVERVCAGTSSPRAGAAGR
jgi:fructokinase